MAITITTRKLITEEASTKERVERITIQEIEALLIEVIEVSTATVENKEDLTVEEVEEMIHLLMMEMTITEYLGQDQELREEKKINHTTRIGIREIKTLRAGEALEDLNQDTVPLVMKVRSVQQTKFKEKTRRKTKYKRRSKRSASNSSGWSSVERNDLRTDFGSKPIKGKRKMKYDQDYDGLVKNKPIKPAQVKYNFSLTAQAEKTTYQANRMTNSGNRNQKQSRSRGKRRGQDNQENFDHQLSKIQIASDTTAPTAPSISNNNHIRKQNIRSGSKKHPKENNFNYFDQPSQEKPKRKASNSRSRKQSKKPKKKKLSLFDEDETTQPNNFLEQKIKETKKQNKQLVNKKGSAKQVNKPKPLTEAEKRSLEAVSISWQNGSDENENPYADLSKLPKPPKINAPFDVPDECISIISENDSSLSSDESNVKEDLQKQLNDQSQELQNKKASGGAKVEKIGCIDYR